jgi:hypothetical protein
MQALIDFLGSYEPLYRQIVKGYSSSEIARFEQALGRPTPPAHRDFLSTAAANVGFLVGDVTFDIEEITDLAALKRPLLERMSDQLTPIAVDLSPSAADYYMHLGRPTGDGDGEIVRSGAGGSGFDDIHSDPSLRDMLFFVGFCRIRMLPLEHRCRVVWYAEDFPEQGPVPNLGALHLLLGELGFHSLNMTGPTVPLYERGDSAAAVHKNWTGHTFSIYLAAQTPQVVDTISEILCDNMPGRGMRRRG